MTWEVIQGDNLATMRGMPDNSVDSIVCDPPYGFGPKQPGLAELLAYLQGADIDTAGDFMGKDWSFPTIAQWRECFRVLKPGGHLVAFAGARTVDLMALGIRAAGFEVRDNFLVWHHGQGFPKSADISKLIDKHLGAEREVVPASGGLHKNANLNDDGWSKIGSDAATMAGPVPITPEAKQWDGWGTALKPSFEPAIIARKPPEGTIVENVLRYGTGGINVDACRVGTGEDKGVWPITDRGNGESPIWGSGTAKPTNPNVGRWPPNAAFVHAEGCEGECAPGCPVAELARQSGVSKSVASAGRNGKDQAVSTFGLQRSEDNVRGHSDTGTATRFFPQFEAEPPFLYAPKASKSEREAGCEHLPIHTAGELTDREEGSAGLDSPRAGAGRTSKGRHNPHPTVKPIAVMAWLIRLVTPPGGVVLDPWCGSGSTGCAAVKQGFRFIGCELDANYAKVAEARIQHWETNHANKEVSKPKQMALKGMK
jgi:DNA modification methylase